jgi:hypothetical protein
MLVLEDRELALLAHGVGDHLPVEVAEGVLELCARRATLAPVSPSSAHQRFARARAREASPFRPGCGFPGGSEGPQPQPSRPDRHNLPKRAVR